MKQVGKRLLSLLLALCMMMSLCVSALAVNDVTVTATLDTPTLYRKSVAQTVKLRVATSEPITICDYQVKLKLPEGWTVTAMENDDANAQLVPADYNLATVDAKYTESGEMIPVTEDPEGTYTIEGKYITGDAITITITKTAKWKWTVEVSEYVKVGKAQSVFLITAKLNDGVTLDAGSTLAYGDELMYRNEAQYKDAYAYLLFSDKTQNEVKAEAETEGKISIVTGEAHTFDLTGDVNGTERIDVNDVQMVYNIYKAKYTAFDANTTMEKFLAADLNGDRMITVDDAVVVVNKIK